MAERMEYEVRNAFQNFLGNDAHVNRVKQHKFSSQDIDIKIESGKYRNVGIECKSVDARNTDKLYFSQHFSESDGKHQVENISEYLDRSGAVGLLAVELRRGSGKKKKCFLVGWKAVENNYKSSANGFEINSFEVMVNAELGDKDFPVRRLPRNGSNYVVNEEIWNWVQNL